MSRKLSVSIFSILFLTFILVATARADIYVGIAGPLSGSAQTTGEQQEIGAQAAIDHLNKMGGVLDQEIISISMDDDCESRQAKAVARQLVNEGVVFVAGHLCSGCSLAASKIYEDAGILMISPASTNPKVTDEGGPNVFRVIGRDDQQGTIAGDFLADKYGEANIAIIHDGEAYGRGLAEFTKLQLNKKGIKELLFAQYAKDQKDYQPIVDKLAENRIDVLYAGGYDADIGIIIRQAKKTLPEIRLVSGDALVSPDFQLYAGEAGEGTYFTFVPDMRLNPEAEEVVATIQEEYGFEPEGYTLYAYGAVQAWAQAVEQANSFDLKDVIKVLKSGTFDTVLGKIGFDDKGDVTGISSFVWNVFEKQGYVPVQ
ncbi:MAG: branched-chain amino acid ABC transporter substrate-binding protein [Desulfocapsaceae bacterium]